MSVSKTFVKNEPFNLESLDNLKTEDSKFSRIGYTFKNWYDAAGKTYADRESVTFSAENVDISADWTIKQFAVLYTKQYKDGDEVIGNVAVTAGGAAVEPNQSVDFGTTLSITATPTYTGKLTSFKINGEEQLTAPTTNPVTKTYTISTETNVSIAMTFSDNQGTITYHPGY